MVKTIDLHDLVRFYLPHFVTAGDYLRRIQSQVVSLPKAGDTGAVRALTTADLSVQNLFEVVTLSRYPQVVFHSEEESQSLNALYFPRRGAYRFILDPLDGTRPFRDGLAHYCIVLTVMCRRTVVAVMLYLPATGRFFIAVERDPTMTTTRGTLAGETQLAQFGGDSDILHVDPLPAGMLGALDDRFTVKEIERDYNPREWPWPKHGILTGEVRGLIKFEAALEDWGAIAFLAERMGGIVTDIGGKKIPNYLNYPGYKIPSLVVARDREFHERIIAVTRQFVRKEDNDV
ncbi:MAG: inositol monophosphatase family protein [bacterium]|nr:inositol monophosphatase family protein [bacterium]MDZ4296383.1 inositol monophosphatase family protein [Patescibacteria group bacterium]